MGSKDGMRWLLGAALLLATTLAAPALARTVLELDAARQPVPLQDWGDFWIDPAGDASVDSVMADPAIVWTPTHEGTIYPLTTGRALWIRFTVPPSRSTERWYLEIPYPSVDLVTLHTPDSLGRWAPLSAGDTLAVADWPVPHRHPFFPVIVPAMEPRQYVLRVENSLSFSAPLSFVSESYLTHREQRVSLVLGMYFGLAGLAVTLAVLGAVSLRDNAHGLYALSVGLMGLTQASMTGIGGLHLWPQLPWWNNLSPLVLPVLAVAALLWFFSAVISLRDRSRTLHRLLMALSALGAGVAAVIPLVEPSLRFRLMALYVLLAIVSCVAVIVWAVRRGDRYAAWLLACQIPVMIGGAFPLARTLGLIPVSFWTMHAMQIGVALELPLLLAILTLRSQQRREHNRRIHGMDRLDPATGLINVLVFTERLERLIARSRRLNYQSAVLLVDIANVETIRSAFGIRGAEDLPLRVAGRLLSAAREIDSVARLSEFRFGVLIEGPLTPEEAASAGPRVVARCLMPYRNKPLKWVAQVRVAQTLVPVEGSGANTVIDRLEAVLAAAPATSKRAVYAMPWGDAVA